MTWALLAMVAFAFVGLGLRTMAWNADADESLWYQFYHLKEKQHREAVFMRNLYYRAMAKFYLGVAGLCGLLALAAVILF